VRYGTWVNLSLEQQRAFMISVAQELGISKMEDWYTVSGQTFKSRFKGLPVFFLFFFLSLHLQ
jgi:hypothetical protein